MDTIGIEAEYIKNLQQQIYFLELETNYLYPLAKLRCVDPDKTFFLNQKVW